MPTRPSSQELEFRVIGSGIAPGSIKSRELGEVIRALEEMIAAKVANTAPGQRADEVVVGLFAIESGSVRLRFRSPLIELVLPAYLAIAGAVRTNDYSAIPNASLDAMREIVAFAGRHRCRCELWVGAGREQLAQIDADTEVPSALVAEGASNMLGRVIRVGGRRPKAMVETIQGETVFCDVSRDLAQALGHRLYELVELSGTARWSPDTWAMEAFEITGFREVSEVPASKTMEALAKTVGAVFDGIIDVPGFVRALRRGEEAI